MYGNDAGIRNKRKTAGAGIPGLLLVFWIGMPRRFVPGKNCLGVYCILGGRDSFTAAAVIFAYEVL